MMISYRQIDNSFVLVALDEIIDEVSIEDGLKYSCCEGDHDQIFPSVYPNYN